MSTVQILVLQQQTRSGFNEDFKSDRNIAKKKKTKSNEFICSGCEYNERRIGTNWCSECGCIIPVKTAAPWMSCPMKKWNSMWSDEQEQEYGIKRQNS